ncbi:MAG: hypothetical protein KGJ99_08705, partial [Betaproteobacteria bacterium]|nr:hypothetical protein [Betaproteobacteria bacterium]
MNTRISKISVLGLLAMLALAIPGARASDIDIYGASAANGPLPNIIIAVDNAGRDNSNVASCPYASTISTSTISGVIQCALYGAVQGITSQPTLVGKFNLGLMVYGAGSNQGGQWIIPSIVPGSQNVTTPLLTMDSNGISTFLSTLATPIGTQNSASVSGVMQESWAFFTGTTKVATEVFGSNTTYVSHEALSCQKSFIIFIGGATKNGNPETGNTGGVGGAAGLANAGATSAQQVPINYSNLGPNLAYNGSKSWGDEWSRFLYQTDFSSTQNGAQNITTYTIAADGFGQSPNLDYVEFLQSMANQGGGKAFQATDMASLTNDILQIFNEVQAVNSVFASSSLPISSNTQGTYQNQVFIGMFRPDANANPRWMGNLKQYQFGVGGTPSNPTLFLADANGNAAISGAGTGFLSPTAVSFWNPAIDTSKLPDSIGGFWVNNPQGAGGGYDNPDGEIVEKGGVGQQIRLANLLDNYTSNPTGPRNVYTCTPTAVADAACSTGALSLTPFATSNGALTATALGITNATYTANINSISRNSSTGKVTVTLSATPSPAIADPTLVTISGSASGQYDYALAGTSPTTSGTTITYTLPAEYPPIPPSASYKVTGPAAGKSNITSLTRNSDVGWFLGTAVLSDPTFSGGSNVAVGDVITIANSIGGYYDGSNATVVSVSGGNTVTFRKAETPNPLGGGGTISNTNGSASIGASTGTPPGVVRGTSCSGCTTNSGKVLMVTIPGGTKQLNPKTAALAN